MSGEAALELRTPDGARTPIYLEPGALDLVATVCEAHAPGHRTAVIADSQVARLYGDRVVDALRQAGRDGELVTFPAGEWNKTREVWAGLSDRLLAAGFGRDSAIVALGGGVTGDLAGFVAATYMRGVPVIQVPTSLLAMLDSSVGGKTGVDTEAGKNLIGAFHHPSAVVIDPLLLETLPRHQLCAGLAEGIKTAAILDEDLWAWIEDRTAPLLEGDPETSARLVERVVRHKADVVRADPREGGLRAILNFGHTVGHALEALGGYTLLHGEAVAAGMRTEARLGEAMGITDPGTSGRIAELLEACELGSPWEGERRPDRIREVMMRDKKARNARVRCVLLARIGSVALDPGDRHTFELDDAALGEALDAALRPASDA